MLHDALREARTNARHARQQRCRCRIDVDADRVDAILDHRIERARQMAFAEIVLILADADRLGIDLDELGERILQPPRDRHRPADGDVELRQFLRGKGGRRINRCAGFGDHDLGHLQVRQPLHEFGGELVGLARGGAVTDRDEIDAMGDRKLAEHRQRLVPAPLRFMRKHRGGVQDLAGRIDHGHLDAGAIPGIEPHRHPRAGRRREQEVAQVRGEHADGFRFGLRPKPQPQIDIEMDLNLGAPRPAHGLRQPGITRAALLGDIEALHDFQLVGVENAWLRSLALPAGSGD